MTDELTIESIMEPDWPSVVLELTVSVPKPGRYVITAKGPLCFQTKSTVYDLASALKIVKDATERAITAHERQDQ